MAMKISGGILQMPTVKTEPDFKDSADTGRVYTQSGIVYTQGAMAACGQQKGPEAAGWPPPPTFHTPMRHHEAVRGPEPLGKGPWF